MSTEANVKIVDELSKQSGRNIWFYRHFDGEPESTLPTLMKFMQWVEQGKIRDTAIQASGWLIIIGAEEYGKFYTSPLLIKQDTTDSWKVGAYEPTTGEHACISYLYILDLDEMKIEVWKKGFNSSQGLLETITNFNI